MEDKLRISAFYLQHSLNIYKAFVLSKKSNSTAYSYLYFLRVKRTNKHSFIFICDIPRGIQTPNYLFMKSKKFLTLLTPVALMRRRNAAVPSAGIVSSRPGWMSSWWWLLLRRIHLRTSTILSLIGTGIFKEKEGKERVG